jgi:acetylornithine/LysW-gamma-L-lysine aminotransferase
MELERAGAGTWIPRRGTPPITRAEGCTLYDVDGGEWLDMTASFGVACLGHCHPAVVKAVQDQAGKVMASPIGLYSEARAELLEKLVQILPGDINHVFLCNSGTEAIEAGIKFARLKNGRRGIVSLKGSFHGRTLGALSVTWNPKIRKPFEPILGDGTFATPGDIDQLNELITEETSIFIAEPVQGEGGVNVLDAEYLQAAEKICREKGVVFMLDEIQTGFGRTGTMFAHSELGVNPDLMAMAKGLGGGFPMGGLAYTPEIHDALSPGVHGSTFGGNPLACAVASAVIDVLVEENIPARAAKMGEYLQAKAREALKDNPKVREIRGKGLMFGVDLREKSAKHLGALTAKHHVIALPAGQTVLRMLPALTVTEAEIDTAVAAIVDVLS